MLCGFHQVFLWRYRRMCIKPSLQGRGDKLFTHPGFYTQKKWETFQQRWEKRVLIPILTRCFGLTMVWIEWRRSLTLTLRRREGGNNENFGKSLTCLPDWAILFPFILGIFGELWCEQGWKFHHGGVFGAARSFTRSRNSWSHFKEFSEAFAPAPILGSLTYLWEYKALHFANMKSEFYFAWKYPWLIITNPIKSLAMFWPLSLQ